MDEKDGGFLIAIEPSTPTIRKRFRKINTNEDVSRVAKAIETILTTDSEIEEVCSFAKEETDT